MWGTSQGTLAAWPPNQAGRCRPWRCRRESSRAASQLERSFGWEGCKGRRRERGTSTACPLEEELREEADAHGCRPLRLVRHFSFGVGRAGDVQVHPRETVDELAQEPAAGDGAGAAAGGVLHVGDIGLEQIAVLVPQREGPAALTGALTGGADFFDQRVVVAH